MENKEAQPVRFAPGSMDHVLDETSSPEVREKILRIAHQSGVHSEDPVWTLILLILEANTAKEWSGKAAQAAGEAADRTRREIQGLPNVIITSVGAGMDVAANKLKEAEDKIIEGAEKAIKKAEGEAKKAMADASADLVTTSGGKIVNAFSSASAKLLWSRAVWAGLVLLVVGIGSYAAGEVDIWWHSRKLSQIQEKIDKLESEETDLKTQIAIIKADPVYGAILNCDGQACVPITGGTYTISSDPGKGTTLGILNMPVINARIGNSPGR